MLANMLMRATSPIPNIQYVGKSIFAASTGSPTPSAVSGVVSGDLILLFVESANQAVSAPSGFSSVPGGTVSAGTAAAAGGMLLTIFYRFASGVDTSTTVADSGNHTSAIKLVYRGVDPISPFDATPVTATKTTASASSVYPGITTVTDGSVVIFASALDLDQIATSTTSSQANSNVSGLTERHDETTGNGVGGGIVITDCLKSVAGPTGDMTASVVDTRQVYVTLALRPAL